MITSVRFCLSYGFLNVILLPSKFAYFNENLHFCKGHHHDITCSGGKCYVKCGQNIIYNMTLSTDSSKTLFICQYFSLYEQLKFHAQLS